LGQYFKLHALDEDRAMGEHMGKINRLGVLEGTDDSSGRGAVGED